jgi:hypothetical protein
MKSRLGKQVASMGDVFEFTGSEGTMELHHDTRIEELSEFCKELKTSTFVYRKIGDGLLLFGTRTARRSLQQTVRRCSATLDREAPRSCARGAAHHGSGIQRQ